MVPLLREARGGDGWKKPRPSPQLHRGQHKPLEDHTCQVPTFVNKRSWNTGMRLRLCGLWLLVLYKVRVECDPRAVDIYGERLPTPCSETTPNTISSGFRNNSRLFLWASLLFKSNFSP